MFSRRVFPGARWVGKALIATSAYCTRAASTGGATSPGSATATRAGAGSSATKVSATFDLECFNFSDIVDSCPTFSRHWANAPSFELSRCHNYINHRDRCANGCSDARKTLHYEPMPGQCWSSVCDAGPTLTRHWFTAS